MSYPYAIYMCIFEREVICSKWIYDTNTNTYMEPIDNSGLTDSGVIEDQRINYQWGIACSILLKMCQYYNSCDNSRWSYRWLSARLQ